VPEQDAGRYTVTLPPDVAEAIRQLGGGKLSAGVRALYEAHLKAQRRRR
jgi:hypothetical protein